MSYNKAKEFKKWTLWKKKEEDLLRKLGVDEKVIMQLREYDYQILLSERRVKRKQIVTKDVFFLNIPSYDKREIRTVEDILDNIENEVLFSYLSKMDSKTLYILLLKLLGYSTSEISKTLQIDEGSIYGRIHRLRKKIKKI